FGLAVVEAMGAGAVPLLPARLSYPEIVPRGLHAALLYADAEDLAERLAAFLEAPQRLDAPRPRVAAAARRFDWRRLIDRYDRLFDADARRAPS
ncbi:MAG: glycosyltransferase, partial [Myxococcales bacterium]|nr:glycosyltransferase [Myxococcales bacterium]